MDVLHNLLYNKCTTNRTNEVWSLQSSTPAKCYKQATVVVGGLLLITFGDGGRVVAASRPSWHTEMNSQYDKLLTVAGRLLTSVATGRDEILLKVHNLGLVPKGKSFIFSLFYFLNTVCVKSRLKTSSNGLWQTQRHRPTANTALATASRTTSCVKVRECLLTDGESAFKDI